MNAIEKHPGFAKADRIVVKVCKYISYPTAVLLFIIALLATINVITSKTVKWIVPSNIDWITYLMIPIVFLSLAHVQLDRGLVVVDFVNSHYPAWLKKTMDIICDLLLMLLNGFLSYRAFVLMMDKFAVKEISSTDPWHFLIWPFCGFLALGMLMFAFTSLWCVFRTITGVKTNIVVKDEENPEMAVAEEQAGGGAS